MPKTRILLVDDDSNNLKVIASFFKNQAYEIMYAPNGADGYDIALVEQPDLILMDWAMPIMNGHNTVLKIKATKQLEDIPIVMATGVMTTSQDLKQALEAGAVDYVRKPYDKLELTSRIHAALRLSRSYRELKEKNQQIEVLMKREQELLHRELGQKERELSRMAITTYEKDQFLNGLRKELQALEKKPSKEGFLNLYKSIKLQLSSEESWSSFMHHFENVHPDFFALLEQHQLTTNELKLASYLKIGMTNKEISSLTGVEPGTVKSNVYRLKKKMGLDPEANLRQYIINLKK